MIEGLPALFAPVDPGKVSVQLLVDRMLVLWRLPTLPDDPLLPGQYRCFTCRRVRDMSCNIEQMQEELYSRRGYIVPLEYQIMVCNACYKLLTRETVLKCLL